MEPSAEGPLDFSHPYFRYGAIRVSAVSDHLVAQRCARSTVPEVFQEPSTWQDPDEKRMAVLRFASAFPSRRPPEHICGWTTSSAVLS